MKESSKKLTRGQMVYAPITSSERTSKSPFAQSKRIMISSRKQQQVNEQQEQTLKQSIHQSAQSFRQSTQSEAQLSPQQVTLTQQPLSIMKISSSPYHDYQEQLQQLTHQCEQLSKQNELLKSREQIYISKLLKLQQGLQKQHEQFMNLQELYTELFNVYKQKEEEIAELELRYKETERQRADFNSFSRRDQNNSYMSIDKMNSIRNTLLEDNLKNELAQLYLQNKRLNQTNQKIVAELNYLKSKQKLKQSKQNLSNKIVDDLNDWQTQLSQQREEKIKLQYENKFFKMRNQDLEKTITDLEKIISMKQNEIIKMREDKINIRRQSSEKVLNRSPSKQPNMDSARSKGSNQQSKKYTKVIENLQRQNHRLRQQNLELKEKIKSNVFQKQNSRLAESNYNKFGESTYGYGSKLMSLHKKLDFSQKDDKYNQNSIQSYQNENFNSQNTNEQYFSFSRQREERQSEEDLPTFPMDLEIQGIIRKHQKNSKQNQTGQNVLQDVSITI